VERPPRTGWLARLGSGLCWPLLLTSWVVVGPYQPGLKRHNSEDFQRYLSSGWRLLAVGRRAIPQDPRDFGPPQDVKSSGRETRAEPGVGRPAPNQGDPRRTRGRCNRFSPNWLRPFSVQNRITKPQVGSKSLPANKLRQNRHRISDKRDRFRVGKFLETTCCRNINWNAVLCHSRGCQKAIPDRKDVRRWAGRRRVVHARAASTTSFRRLHRPVGNCSPHRRRHR
jgi:hypothetical protein